MKNSSTLLTLCVFSLGLIISSCGGGGGGKKVLVMASGKVTVNGNTINLQPGTSHNEATFVPEGDNVTVVSPDGSKEYPISENGYYLLNLKKDTIVGSRQRVGSAETAQQEISLDNLKVRIDSLQQLMAGTNVNEQAGTFNIPPSTIKKLTDNTNADIIGPFKSAPTSFDPNKEYEIYKFFTNKETAELVEKFRKMVAEE